MFLLLFMAVEVLACDLVPSDDCYISSHLPNPDKNGGQSPGDTCLCCCQHMTVAIPFLFNPDEIAVPAPPEMSVRQPLFPPSRVEHPPQLA